jgi:tetratricopeptide (TPR) repeat protein
MPSGESGVSRRGLGAIGAAALLALAVLLWLARERGPRVVEEGEALPFDEPVEMRFVDEASGATETWKLEKKVTTREESLGASLPEPDPTASDREPDESARTLDAIALEAWKSGDLESAVRRFEEAIAADPDDRVPRSHYGRLLTLMTDYERALPHLERAAALAPDDPQAWLDLQTLYERALRLDRAIEARERAEALAGGRAIRQDPMGYYEIEGAPSFP